MAWSSCYCKTCCSFDTPAVFWWFRCTSPVRWFLSTVHHRLVCDLQSPSFVCGCRPLCERKILALFVTAVASKQKKNDSSCRTNAFFNRAFAPPTIPLSLDQLDGEVRYRPAFVAMGSTVLSVGVAKGFCSWLPVVSCQTQKLKDMPRTIMEVTSCSHPTYI